MFIRFVTVFLFLLTLSVFATDSYPQTYSKLGTPLFTAATHLSEYKDVESLTFWTEKYRVEVNKTTLLGLEVDKLTDKSKKRVYLQKLRKLQSLYERVLHQLHTAIAKSIKDDDYKQFLKLTSYAFDGLFSKSNLRNQAIGFYAKHKFDEKQGCVVLDKKISDEILSQKTEELFAAEIVHSSYDSQDTKSKKKSVGISVQRVKNSIRVSFYNRNIYDVTIQVHSRLNNISFKTSPPKEFVIKAKSTYEYGILVLGSGQSQYSFSWSYMMGSKDAQHNDNYIYKLPFAKGTSHIVSQGYNGKETHKGNSAYSIDFSMPIGTKIYASRDGIVVKTKENSDKGGYDKKFASSGNYVTILHDDGTFATYYHLKYNGVIVSKGERVFAGQALGYSGNTGYSSGPHLHFAVFKVVGADKRVTIATKILTSEGILEKPDRGHSYLK